MQTEGCLESYVCCTYSRAYNELDYPLFLGLSKGATETLSRVRLNDITTENAFHMEEHYLVSAGSAEEIYSKRIRSNLTMSDFMGLVKWEA